MELHQIIPSFEVLEDACEALQSSRVDVERLVAKMEKLMTEFQKNSSEAVRMCYSMYDDLEKSNSQESKEKLRIAINMAQKLQEVSLNILKHYLAIEADEVKKGMGRYHALVQVLCCSQMEEVKCLEKEMEALRKYSKRVLKPSLEEKTTLLTIEVQQFDLMLKRAMQNEKRKEDEFQNEMVRRKFNHANKFDICHTDSHTRFKLITAIQAVL